MTRDELDLSNSTNITGAGKVTKLRHSTHNNNIADYIDFKTAILNSVVAEGAPLVLVVGTVYTYNGEDVSTFILPPITGNAGKWIAVISFSSENLTIESNSGGNDIWTAGSLSDSLIVTFGQFIIFYDNSLKWVAKI